MTGHPSIDLELSAIDRLTTSIDRFLAAPHASVLIVDDEVSTLRVLRRILENGIPGLAVTTAETISEARRLLGLDGSAPEIEPGLVLTDIHLSDGSGATLAGDIPHRTPVALMSGMVGTGRLERLGRRLRMTTINKPFESIEDLIALVRAELAAGDDG